MIQGLTSGQDRYLFKNVLNRLQIANRRLITATGYTGQSVTMHDLVLEKSVKILKCKNLYAQRI